MTRVAPIMNAYHEAGHAVAIIVACQELGEIETFDSATVQGNIPHVEWSAFQAVGSQMSPLIELPLLERLERARRMKWQIVIALAGSCAHAIRSRIGLGLAVFCGGTGDCIEAKSLAADIKVLSGEVIDLDRALKETKAIMREHWSMVDVIARELLKRGTLTGSEAESVLAKALTPDSAIS